MEINKNTENQNYFCSDDILLCSFLLTQGIKFIETHEDYPRHYIFLLSNSDKCNELKQLYLNNASAPARELFANREMLLSEIKNKGRNGNSYGTFR